MDIIGNILKFLKGVNLKYEKNEDSHSIDLNLKDEPTTIEGSLSVKINKDKEPEISASLGKGRET